MTKAAPPALLTRIRRAAASRSRRTAARLGIPSDRDLIISFLFPPANETAGIVMAKRLRAWPRDVDVIANEPPGKRAPDPGTLKIAGPRVKRVARVKGKKNPLKDWAVVANFVAKGDAEIRRFEGTRGPYRRVHSRAMMPASHFLAMQYKLRRPAVRWTAEFSDPLMYDTHGDLRYANTGSAPLAQEIAARIAARGVTLVDPDNLFELVEYGAYVLADTVLFTNAVQRDLMLSKITHDGLRNEVLNKSVVSAHPVPAAELYELVEPTFDVEPTRLEIGYFGAFYTRRSAGDILTPFHHLTRAERRRVRLRIFTDKVDPARAAVDDAGLTDCVEVRPYMPFLEFLAATKRLDLLLLADARVADSHAANPYLPSKLSDYRGSGTPIWALVEPGSPLSREEGTTSTPLDDVDAQVAYLRAAIAAH
ncbi:hypothetical protein ACTVCO_05395 [Sanguibacter sp. A247]|uniref:hypothetical protein n=1 Tax=unclassified Sanguibacter TaxID=2645534 RepID=UPI003FD74F2D